MDYEKAYDEALERAKKVLNCEANDREPGTSICEYIFPELAAESEDEKVRKVLIDLVKCNERSGYKLLNNIPTSSILTWLEKQGEKKSSDEVLKIRQELYQSGYNDGYKHGIEDKFNNGE